MTILLEIQSAADLEELRRNTRYRVVGIVTPDVAEAAPVKRRWAGSISPETGRMLQEEVTKMRSEEWDRDF